jgi:hypothetical protein
LTIAELSCRHIQAITSSETTGKSQTDAIRPVLCTIPTWINHWFALVITVNVAQVMLSRHLVQECRLVCHVDVVSVKGKIHRYLDADK